MQLFTDDSGANGWDAYWNGRWIQGQWSEVQLNMDITWNTWGSLWQKQKILFHCDNQAVAKYMGLRLHKNKRDHGLSQFITYIILLLSIILMHVLPDCLSHFKQERFKKLALQANPHQTASLLGQPSPSSTLPAVLPSGSSSVNTSDLCHQFGIVLFSLSLTLEYFCSQTPRHISPDTTTYLTRHLKSYQEFVLPI